MEHVIALYGNNLKSEVGGNITQILCQFRLKFQAEVLCLAVTQSTENSGDRVIYCVYMLYGSAEADVFQKLPLAICHNCHMSYLAYQVHGAS